jgi:hypothetical protein
VDIPIGFDCPDACDNGSHVENCPTVTGHRPETQEEYERLYGPRHQDVADDDWRGED